MKFKNNLVKKITSGTFEQIRQKYKIDKKAIGTGSFGKVFIGKMIANEKIKVAIKAIPKAKGINFEKVKQEVLILCQLDHPNIVKYYESFENNNYFYIVMEFCEGGELFEKLTSQEIDHLTEAET